MAAIQRTNPLALGNNSGTSFTRLYIFAPLYVCIYFPSIQQLSCLYWALQPHSGATLDTASLLSGLKWTPARQTLD